MPDDPETAESRIQEAERVARKALDAIAGPASLAAEPAPNEHPSDLEKGQRNIKDRTALMILELASHTLVLGLALGSLWLIHLILAGLFGKNGKFFNYVPISWIIDAADLLVIGKFLWGIIKDFRRD